jgi:hypothetical protein
MRKTWVKVQLHKSYGHAEFPLVAVLCTTRQEVPISNWKQAAEFA